MAIEIKTFDLGMVAANCYIVKDTVSGDALLVDPGSYNSRLENLIKEAGIEKLRYILLTHGHFDHIMGVKRTKSTFGGKVVIHLSDLLCTTDSNLSLASAFGFESEPFGADILVKDGDKLPFGEGEIEVIHTPGHTTGSVCYKLGDVLFTGDTLFRMTVGRTDFPGGSYEILERSLKKLSSLQGDFKIYPGHESESTLEFERLNNPYMKGI